MGKQLFLKQIKEPNNFIYTNKDAKEMFQITIFILC